MLSICIPAYNYLDYTKEAVSKLLQEDEDFELIVCDDFYLLSGDADGKRRIDEMRSLFSSDKRIVSVSNNYQIPIQENWNKTVRVATRPYIKMMGADDGIAVGGVKKLLNMIEDDPISIFHGHLAEVIDAEGKVVRRQRPYTTGESFGFVSGGAAALKLKLRQVARFKEPVCNMYKKDAWEKVGGYSKKYRFCFDIELNTKLMNYGQCHLWNIYIAELRRHTGSDGAKLPAALAVNDLRNLINDIYQSIGGSLSVDDRRAGETLLAYRVVELILARYTKNPRELRAFLRETWPLVDRRYFSTAALVRMLGRRVLLKDVQKTINATAIKSEVF